MTAQEIITAVRADILNDVAAPYRWSDEFLLRKLSDGQRELFKRRPDVGMGAATVILAPNTLTSTASVLQAGDEWRGALIDYVAFRAFEMDAEHAENIKRSQHHLQLFAAQLQ
jgi:hypothetical protein